MTSKSFSSFQGVQNISPEEFLQLPCPPLLIDVRSSWEYRTGHAPQGLNLSLPRLLLGSLPFLRRWLLPQWFRDLAKDEPIAVVCLTSHRSPIAAQRLVKEGFTQVFNLTGGMMKWRSLGLEIPKGR